MSSALTRANRDRAIAAALEQYQGYLTVALSEHQRILAAAQRQEEKGRLFPDRIHIAKLEVIVKALEELQERMGTGVDPNTCPTRGEPRDPDGTCWACQYES